MTKRAIVAERCFDVAHFRSWCSPMAACNIAVPQAMQRLVGSRVEGQAVAARPSSQTAVRSPTSLLKKQPPILDLASGRIDGEADENSIPVLKTGGSSGGQDRQV